MPPLSGYGSTLPTDVLLDAAVLYVNGSTPYSALKNLSVNLGQTWKNLADEIDGAKFPIEGLDVRTGGVQYIEGELQEVNATLLADFEPGGTIGTSTTTAGTTTTLTPKTAGDLLATGAYKTNVRIVLRRGGGAFCWVVFPIALMRVESMQGANNGVGSFKVRIEARQDPAAASTGVAPYQIVTAPAV